MNYINMDVGSNPTSSIYINNKTIKLLTNEYLLFYILSYHLFLSIIFVYSLQFFSFMFLYKMVENYYNSFSLYNNTLFNTYIHETHSKSIMSINKIDKSNDFFISKLILKNQKLAKSKDFFENNKNDKFIFRTFWQKFINQYWQETVFLSLPDSLSEIHVNKLKTDGIYIYKGNDYKNFLLQFNKALINGKIKVYINDLVDKDSFLKNKNSIYIKYIWKKQCYLYFSFMKYFKPNTNNIINFSYKAIKAMTYNTLPLFTLVNNSNQLIMAESSEELLMKKNIFDSLSGVYNKFFINQVNTKKIYTGLFFINSEDAVEYKNYIKSKYLKSSRSNGIESFVSPLHIYYKLLQLSIRNIEFKLIPDLQEVSQLIYKYQYYKNIIFSKSQKYGKNYFQGQPIYLIQPCMAKHKYLNNKNVISYTYSDNKNSVRYKYQAIFLNYRTAIHAWNLFREQYTDYRLPVQPIIKVSNLEDFLNKNINTNNIKNKELKQILFVPSLETYTSIKNHLNLRYHNNLNQIISNKLLVTKSLFQRMIWSLTSRQPINW